MKAWFTVPGPDGAAVTITDSPEATAALVTMASCAVTYTLGMAAASAHDMPSGIRISARCGTATNSA